MLSPQPEPSSISDVERDTGVAKETLRVWERRYAFPQPLRDVHGERVYPADQVQKLRLVQRLLDLGYRPGKIMQLDHASLSQMAQQRGSDAVPGADSSPALQRYLDMIKAHQMPELRQQLAQLQLHIGIEGLVRELLAPLTARVGQAWASGELAVYEEHLYTESVQTVLHNALFALSQHRASASPRVLLTTVPQEQHALGLLMAETMLSLHGAQCISLGVQTPIAEIVAAAASQRADIVALSFSSAISLRDTLRSLDELRARLPAAVEIWAGGSRANEGQRKIAQLQAHVLDLGSVAASLERWRIAQR